MNKEKQYHVLRIGRFVNYQNSKDGNEWVNCSKTYEDVEEHMKRGVNTPFLFPIKDPEPMIAPSVQMTFVESFSSIAEANTFADGYDMALETLPGNGNLECVTSAVVKVPLGFKYLIRFPSQDIN